MNEEINNKAKAIAESLWRADSEFYEAVADYIYSLRDGDDEVAEEYKYPIFKKSTYNGDIERFDGLKTRTTVFSPNNETPIGETTNIATRHSNKDYWEDVPYDRDTGLWHGCPCYAWDNGNTHYRAIYFYNAISRLAFSSSGKLKGILYKNYRAIPTEYYVEWVVEAYRTLEGI